MVCEYDQTPISKNTGDFALYFAGTTYHFCSDECRRAWLDAHHDEMIDAIEDDPTYTEDLEVG